MPRIRKERVNGPYYDDKRELWAVHFIRADGRRRVVRVATEAEARSLIEDGETSAQGRTVSAAVTAYLEHKQIAGLRDGSITTLGYRLAGVLRTGERDQLLHQVRPAGAASLYAQRVGETKADTHRGELAAVQSMFAWCVKQGWIRVNPFAEVAAVGARATGKTQLRVDEARRFLDVALGEKSGSGLAAACALLMGLSASEVTDRVVRDVDDGGRLWWIDKGKTKNRRAHIIVPADLRARLAALVKGRRGDEQLWGDVDRHWLGYHVRRLCRVAGVEVVTPHGLRGLHATLSVSEGVEVSAVAKQLRHGDRGGTARRHYIAPGAVEAAGHERALGVIQGGRS